MRHVSVYLRLLVLLVTWAMLAAGAGWAFDGISGAILAGMIMTAFLAGVAFFSEWLIKRLLWVRPPRADLLDGLHRSMERAIEERGSGRVPRMQVIAEPSANLIVARSWFGKGSVFISQGMLVLLTEEELRAILRLCLKRLEQPDLPLQSLCAVLASWMLWFAPRGWVNSLLAGRPVLPEERRFFNPLSLLRFLMFFPLAQALIRLGGRGAVLGFVPKGSVSRSNELIDALRKIEKSAHLWGASGNPGVVSLYLSPPWPRGNVLSLS